MALMMKYVIINHKYANFVKQQSLSTRSTNICRFVEVKPKFVKSVENMSKLWNRSCIRKKVSVMQSKYQNKNYKKQRVKKY